LGSINDFIAPCTSASVKAICISWVFRDCKYFLELIFGKP
jgi:hypothetical protein